MGFNKKPGMHLKHTLINGSDKWLFCFKEKYEGKLVFLRFKTVTDSRIMDHAAPFWVFLGKKSLKKTSLSIFALYSILKLSLPLILLIDEAIDLHH